MKKLMSITACMFFFVLLFASPCFSTPATPQEETSAQADQTAETDTATTPQEDTASVTDEETATNDDQEATAPEPETKAAAETETATETEGSSDITITEAVICRDVVDREPVGAGDVFSSELPKVMCFTRVVGAKNETEILHNWYFAEKIMASVALRVGSDNWRTYSSKALTPEYAGEWKVEILSQDGELLKKIYFVLE